MIYAFVIFFVFFAWVMYMAVKFRNPYKLIMVFGKKGSGKTTFLTKKAIQYMRAGREVYSTVYVPGAHIIDVDHIGCFTPPPGSVLFIDEVGMIWDNRNFKAFREDVRDWFKLQRHYHVTVYLFSQTFDIDLKLRNLTDEMYLCTCHMGFISIARKIKRSIVLVQPTGESESRIADKLEFVPLWMSLFGAKSAVITYIPNWVRFYDSFETPVLPLVDSVYQEIPEGLQRFFLSHKSARMSAALVSVLLQMRERVPAALARAPRLRSRRK